MFKTIDEYYVTGNQAIRLCEDMESDSPERFYVGWWDSHAGHYLSVGPDKPPSGNWYGPLNYVAGARTRPAARRMYRKAIAA